MKYFLSSAIILLCLGAGKLIMHFIDVSFPAPLLAMVILLVLLLSGIVKEQQLTPCASPILNVMPIFFIPAGVGFIEHLGLIKTHWPFLTTVMIIVPFSSLILVASIVGHFKGTENNE
ncbi:CidA/LrgA family protein [Pseudoalteromonas sp. S201]|uniref:CidA/LrgA family protein n=1 Tax=Pseudoalteromonas sp. S201 TaxID=579519 RepID=UPI00110CE411|nr:CidA/LrgA family protein [Pseudoalteromonas sp. S201]TMS94545.1 CidA/LrgA family protein [Pseudoalteromonas sp. S201]